MLPVLAAETGGTTSRDSSFREEISDTNEDEKENKLAVPVPRRPTARVPVKGEVEAVTDKGLKDPRNFTQQLFNTVAVKMIEWISLPPPTSTLRFAPDGGGDLHKEPPKLKFANPPMDVIDTGRVGKDSEPVSPSQHQVILQQQPRKRGLSLSGTITPTPHSSMKAKLNTTPAGIAMPPPLHHHHAQRRTSTGHMHITPSRKDKGEQQAQTQTLWETPEVLALPPQCLKKLDRELCQALVDMCQDGKAAPSERQDAREFARQSVFYVLSTPAAALASFGGNGGGIEFDPSEVDAGLEILMEGGWEDLVMRSLWTGIAKVFTKPGKGLKDSDAAGMLVLGLHALAASLTKDEDSFLLAVGMRAQGLVADVDVVAPDIGLDDEMGERLMKRILRALAYREARPGSQSMVASHLTQYLEKCGTRMIEQRREAMRKGKVHYLGTDAVHFTGWSLARCTLEWTRTVFLRNWNGEATIVADALEAACLSLVQRLYKDRDTNLLNSSYFETPILSKRIDYHTVPMQWFQAMAEPEHPLHLLDFPFLFTLESRVTFFRSINMELMKRAYEQSISQIRMTQQMTQMAQLGSTQYQSLIARMDTALSVYCVVSVRRSHLLEDALNQLVRREKRELQRPLKVRFVDGEEGIDQGGVQQEFFALLLREILRPEHGVFVMDERTHRSWFNIGCVEGNMMLELLGIVLGLAMYNGATLPVSFPRALYIKLLGQEPELSDLSEDWPELHRGLLEMLKWADGDVGDVFCRTYEYSYEVYGEVRNVNMLEAEAKGIKSLPRQIPRLSRKTRAVEPPTEPTMQGVDAHAEMAEAVMAEWLPAVPTDETDPWMGSLNEVLEVMRQQERLDSGGQRYTVSFTNLNEQEQEEARGEDSSREQEDASSNTAERQTEDTTRIETIRPVEGIHESPATADVFVDDDIRHVVGAGSRAREARGRNGSDASWETVGHEDEANRGDASTEATLAVAADTLTTTEEERTAEQTPELPAELPEKTDKIHEEMDGQQDPEEEEAQAPTALASVNALPTADDVLSTATDDDVEAASHSATISTAAADAFSSPITSAHSSKPSTPPPPSSPPPEAPLVTNATRDAYVCDYVRWQTTYSVAHLYNPLARGFFNVVAPASLHLFSPAALQQLLEGHPGTLSVDALRAAARYEDGYHADHPTIKAFWEVVRGFDYELRRRLLAFVTSVDRVPVGGVASLGFWVVRNGGDAERVPSSLTCFGRLLLPEYATKEKLERKLRIALENAAGFGNA